MIVRKLTLRVAGTIFGIVCILHALRIITGIPVIVGSWSMPVWINYFGTIGAAVLSVLLWSISIKSFKRAN